jgi:hypothetical protein
MSNPVAATKSLKDFALGFVKMDFLGGTALPIIGGFAGTKLICGVGLPWLLKPSAEKRAKMDAKELEKVDKRWAFAQKWQPLIEVGVGVASGAVAGIVLKKPQFAVKWVTGGILAAASTWLERQEWFQKKTKDLKGYGGGIGQVSDETKAELSKSVERAIERAEGSSNYYNEYEEGMDGTDEYATVDEYASSDDIAGDGNTGAYLTDEDLQSTRQGGGGMDYDTFAGVPSGF